MPTLASRPRRCCTRSPTTTRSSTERLAWLAVVVFLDLNDARPRVSHDAAFDLVMDVAAGKCDVEEIATRLRVGPRRKQG